MCLESAKENSRDNDSRKMENVFRVMEARKMILCSFNSLCLRITNCNPVTRDEKTEMKGKSKHSKFRCYVIINIANNPLNGN